MVKYLVALLVGFLAVCSLAQAEETEQPQIDTESIVIHDPTQPLGYVKKSTKKKTYRQRLPTLQSVVLDNKKKRAIMNNKYYEVGQFVNGYRITRIDKEAVLLVYKAKAYRVSLYSNAEKFSQ